jgi:uncharacterized protein with GYD domain
MPRYMTQFAYTTQAWTALAKNPVDRSEAIGKLAKELGGSLVALHYTMGEYDGVVLSDLPDDTAAMAIAIAAVSPGHVKAIKTTRLYTPSEAVEAMRRAGRISYSAPQ